VSNKVSKARGHLNRRFSPVPIGELQMMSCTPLDWETFVGRYRPGGAGMQLGHAATCMVVITGDYGCTQPLAFFVTNASDPLWLTHGIACKQVCEELRMIRNQGLSGGSTAQQV
jgi:hypothetical protein